MSSSAVFRFGTVLAVSVSPLAKAAAAVPTAFAYQGQLKQGGVPANGAFAMAFSLWNSESGGAEVAPAIEQSNVEVAGGHFTVLLDFGLAAVNGEARWLEVTVAGVTLSPRQPITPAPYALRALAGASNWQDAGTHVFLPLGNVGLGTDQPTQMLHLRRDFYGTGIRFQSSRFDQGPPAQLIGPPTAAATSGNGQVWMNAAAAIGSDDLRAETALLEAVGPDADLSQALQVTDFGFNLPAEATIVGFVVRAEGRISCGCTDCDRCQVPVTVELLGHTEASEQGASNFNVVDNELVAGGPFTTWGLDWTPEQVNSPSFGVQLSAELILSNVLFCLPAPLGCSYQPCDCTGTGSAGIDAVSVTVLYYDVSVTTTPVEWSLGVSSADNNFRVSPTSDLSTAPLIVGTTGNVGIGLNAPDAFFRLALNGTAAKPGGGSWTSLSDARLKRDIQPLSGSLDRMLSLRGVTFEFNEEGLGTGLALPGRQIGLVAQDVERVFPEWVSQSPSGYKFHYRDRIDGPFDRGSPRTPRGEGRADQRTQAAARSA